MTDDRAEILDLFDIYGQRKYLTTAEARRFLVAARRLAMPQRLFCEVLFYTGCRISEALELIPRRLDADDKRIIFRTLKRRKLTYRAVPVPARLLRDLVALARAVEYASAAPQRAISPAISESPFPSAPVNSGEQAEEAPARQSAPPCAQPEPRTPRADSTAPLFPWCRVTGWRIVKGVMEQARIEGPQATARGLRHQFGVHAIEVQIPEPMLQRWMGHARARTTRIYTVFAGDEERRLAKRMW